MRSEHHFRPALPRRGSLRPPHLVGGRRSTSPARFQTSVPAARPNPPRINTSANPSFFIKSLIMNDLKSNRISKRACKPPRINTSENYGCKPFRINTSRNHPGEGVGVKPCRLQTLLELCRPSGAAVSRHCESAAKSREKSFPRVLIMWRRYSGIWDLRQRLEASLLFRNRFRPPLRRPTPRQCGDWSSVRVLVPQNSESGIYFTR
jgi:hypothetical protein